MNIIWFIVLVVLYNIVYWNLLLLVISFPSVTLMPLAERLAANHSPARYPVFFLAIFFGGFLPAALYGIGMGWVATMAASKATYPLAYLILAGIGSFLIRAPNGETSIFAMFISLGAYLIAIFNTRLVQVFENFWDFIMSLLWIIILIAFIAFGVIWVSSLFSKKNEVKRVEGDSSAEKICPKCNKGYDGSWEVCLSCSEKLIDNPSKIIEVEKKDEDNKSKEEDDDEDEPIY